MADLDRKLVESDLDRLIALIPAMVSYTCDIHENPRCLVRDRKEVARGCGSQCSKEIAVVNRAELDRLRRELIEFRRRWKEIYG